MDRISVAQIPPDRRIRSLAAAWSIREWRASFPNDTAQWYLNLYKKGDHSKSIPFTVAATRNGKLIGVGSLVADDELPNAHEPGPWLAAIYVAPQHRRLGAGTEIVFSLLDHAFSLGHRQVYAYTETKLNWYLKMGWEFIRPGTVAGHEVSVIKRKLN